MIRRTKNIFFAPTTPFHVKAGLALELLYCLSPLEFIPEWIPVLGVMDDLGMAALLIAWANRFTLPEDAPPKRAMATKPYPPYLVDLQPRRKNDKKRASFPSREDARPFTAM